MVKDDKDLSATPYQQTHKLQLPNFDAYGAFKTFQVPVTKIELLSSLDFGVFRANDPIANTASYLDADIKTDIAVVIGGSEDLEL